MLLISNIFHIHKVLDSLAHLACVPLEEQKA